MSKEVPNRALTPDAPEERFQEASLGVGIGVAEIELLPRRHQRRLSSGYLRFHLAYRRASLADLGL
jgi:hypothetical protein